MNHKVYIDENPLDVIDKKLSYLHKKEIGDDGKSIDYEIYSNYSCIIFLENGKQIGYYVFGISRHHHYDKILFQDALYYIKKEYRLQYAREVFRIVEEVAKSFDCDLLAVHCKTKSQLNFFNKMNFILNDYLLVKEL